MRARAMSLPSPRSWSSLLALTSLLVVAAPTGTASAEAATPGCTLNPTGGTVTRTVAGRSYTLRVPAGLTGAEVPLLLSLHGFGANSSVQESNTGWSTFAGAKNFIVAYPQGSGGPGSGAWDPYTSTADVTFLRQVADDVAATWCVNPKRIHVDGWSNGAVMSQRAACDAADKFASVTSYGGGTPTAAKFAPRPCSPSRPISVGLFVGQFDFTFAGLSQNVGEWRGYDACGATPSKSTDAYGTTDTYGCANGTQLVARVVKNTSHNWPFGAQAEDQRNRMWAFFQAHPLP